MQFLVLILCQSVPELNIQIGEGDGIGEIYLWATLKSSLYCQSGLRAALTYALFCLGCGKQGITGMHCTLAKPSLCLHFAPWPASYMLLRQWLGAGPTEGCFSSSTAVQDPPNTRVFPRSSFSPLYRPAWHNGALVEWRMIPKCLNLRNFRLPNDQSPD